MANSAKSILTLVLVAVIAGLVGWLVQTGQLSPMAAPEMKKAILLPNPKVLSVTEFIDHDGEPFQSDQFKGHWSVLFFGFTHCPDICPTTLYQLKKVKQELTSQKRWGDLQVVMITVDPARDTPQRLSKYVPFFDPDFIGLTADLPTITEFAKSVGVLFVSHPADQNGRYDVDHTAALILLNPNGEFAGVISAPHQHDELVHDLAALAQSNGATETATATTMAGALELQELWIRPAPPGADAMAAYLTAKNTGRDIIDVVAASSPMFDRVMIHTTTIESEIASMDMIDRLSIAPKSIIKFAPLGTHLMLTGPAANFTANDQVPITLEMADGSTLQGLFSIGVPADE